MRGAPAADQAARRLGAWGVRLGACGLGRGAWGVRLGLAAAVGTATGIGMPVDEVDEVDEVDAASC